MSKLIWAESPLTSTVSDVPSVRVLSAEYAFCPEGLSPSKRLSDLALLDSLGMDSISLSLQSKPWIGMSVELYNRRGGRSTAAWSANSVRRASA